MLGLVRQELGRERGVKAGGASLEGEEEVRRDWDARDEVLVDEGLVLQLLPL